MGWEMNVDKFLLALRQSRDDVDRHCNSYDDNEFYKALATIAALDAVIDAAELAQEKNL